MMAYTRTGIGTRQTTRGAQSSAGAADEAGGGGGMLEKDSAFAALILAGGIKSESIFVRKPASVTEYARRRRRRRNAAGELEESVVEVEVETAPAEMAGGDEGEEALNVIAVESVIAEDEPSTPPAELYPVRHPSGSL